MAKTTIEFNESASEELGRLAETLSTTKADVLRGALSLYAFIVDELYRQEGRQLGIVNNEDKVEKIIVVPSLQTRRHMVTERAERIR